MYKRTSHWLLSFVVVIGCISLMPIAAYAQPSETNQSKISSKEISDGKYSDGQGYGEVFIEVKGDRYRWVDVTQPQLDRTWKPVSELQAVRKGVIYYKNEYLCSNEAPKLDEAPKPRRPGQGFFCVSEGITFKRPTK